MSWDTIPLNDAISTLIDYRGKTPPKSNEGVRLITAKVVKRGRIIDTPAEFISRYTYGEWMKRGLPKQWDILITTEAPLGEVGMIRSAEPIALAQRIILLRSDPTILDQRYLFYALQGDDVQSQLRARASGTTVLGIKQSELRQVKVSFPQLSTQLRVSSILSTYDDLIENNTRRIEILEEMARRLYEEWFVRFRSPGHEDTSPGDGLPEGWRIVRLDSIAEVNPESIKPRSAPETINYIDIASVSPGRIDQVLPMAFSEAPSRARRKVRSEDILWSCVRPNRRSHALALDPESDTIASTGFAVLRATGVPFTFLYQTVRTDEFVQYLVNHATGAAYPAVKASDFEAATIVLPNQDILSKFHEMVEPLLRLGHKLDRKNANLRAQRDLLLPKLISGQIDVSQAEEMIEEGVA